jgi:type III pantothenate kinase
VDWLAIDTGNSRVKFGLFRRDPLATGCSASLATPIEFMATPVSSALPIAELGLWWNKHPFQTVIGGSNPPAITRLLEDWKATPWPEPRVIRDRLAIGVATSVDSPDRVGLDRLLNAKACACLKRNGQPVIIVDSGTATTVDLVLGNGTFAGGTILPGLELSAKSLHSYTALLPQLTPADLRGPAPPVLGKNTEAAMRSGLYWGQVGAIREIVQRLSDQLAPHQPLLLFTGGGGTLLAPHFTGARSEPFLALQGLILCDQP